MKKNIKEYDVKDFELKLASFLLTGTVFITGFKLYESDKKNSTGEINIIKTTNEEVVEETETPVKKTYTYTEIEPQSDEYYKSIKIAGKTLNYLNTPTPTPTPKYEVIDSFSDEIITGEDGVYPDGYFEYVDRKEHKLNFDTVDEAISFYSKVFELNENVSSKVIKDIIGNEEYPLQQEVEINGTTYRTLEVGIARILSNLSNSPSSYGYTEDEIRSTNGYQLKHYYLEELIYKFAVVNDVNPLTATAITYAECGRDIDSYLCVYYCNYGGIVVNGSFAKYRNKAVGAYEYTKMLKDRFGLGPNGNYKDIHGYAADMPYWYNLVGGIEYELKNNGYTSIMEKKGRLKRNFIYCDEEVNSFYNSKYYKLKKGGN
jgi:hypothetical protein